MRRKEKGRSISDKPFFFFAHSVRNVISVESNFMDGLIRIPGSSENHSKGSTESLYVNFPSLYVNCSEVTFSEVDWKLMGKVSWRTSDGQSGTADVQDAYEYPCIKSVQLPHHETLKLHTNGVSMGTTYKERDNFDISLSISKPYRLGTWRNTSGTGYYIYSRPVYIWFNTIGDFQVTVGIKLYGPYSGYFDDNLGSFKSFEPVSYDQQIYVDQTRFEITY